MDTKLTVDIEAFTVELLVHHGNYRATFTGTGATILEAAENAARQSSYASGLFDRIDGLYGVRAEYRAALAEALANGEEYRGFGWNTFKLVGDPTDPGSSFDPVDLAIESEDFPKFVSDEKFEELVEAYAIASRKESIRLFPQSYGETTPLEPFIIEARRNLTEALNDFEYAHTALLMQRAQG